MIYAIKLISWCDKNIIKRQNIQIEVEKLNNSIR